VLKRTPTTREPNSDPITITDGRPQSVAVGPGETVQPHQLGLPTRQVNDGRHRPGVAGRRRSKFINGQGLGRAGRGNPHMRGTNPDLADKEPPAQYQEYGDPGSEKIGGTVTSRGTQTDPPTTPVPGQVGRWAALAPAAELVTHEAVQVALDRG